MLIVSTQDAVNSSVSVTVTITIAPRPEPTWEKMVYLNGVMTDTFPVTVLPSDTIEIVDQVWITYTNNITFALEERWTESLELLTYDIRGLPGGTAVLPEYGTVVIPPAAGLMTVTVADAPSDWGYVITKTFNVLEGDWETDTITETLEVEGAYPQLSPRALQFTYGISGAKIYLPVVMRNSS
jgi:hypothetical protein